jgi:GT2 family glycosyltransferase
MIPVLGFATLTRHDLAERLLKSIDYPVEHLVIIDNSGTQTWNPVKPDSVEKMWLLRMPFGLGYGGAWNLIIKSTPYAPYWVLVNDDAYFEPGALARIANKVDTSALNFLQVSPKWSCVVFGEGAIEHVGLFDENFYPIYFEDNDYERRYDNAGLVSTFIDAVVHHDNSSTLASGFHRQNDVTFGRNQTYFQKKIAKEDFGQGNWSLRTRRLNRWD